MTAVAIAEAPTADDPEAAAADAGLRYVTDADPGYRRRRRGKGFSYVDADGRAVRDERTIERIRALVIPPAWTDVWISADPKGHLQATGRDARGRKQYRYHDRWRAVRDADKYERLPDFGAALGPLRARVDEALHGRTSTRDVVLATVVHLLDETLVRVGNEAYAQDNETFGITTLRSEHVHLGERRVAFRFVGKHGIEQDITIEDSKLARIVKRCHELGGKSLFTYVDDDGTAVCVTSADVNEHLRELVPGHHVTAKDFRTWGGTVTVAEVLGELGPATTAKQADANVVAAIDEAAARLGNTRTVCRSCYVHPGVVDAYRTEALGDAWKAARSSKWYRRAERAALNVLGSNGTANGSSAS